RIGSKNNQNVSKYSTLMSFDLTLKSCHPNFNCFDVSYGQNQRLWIWAELDQRIIKTYQNIQL
ncbi:MAG: hypothetical protein J6X31_10920, partial [Bacteroidales bacterium]|nr:hypothetical protein [Bacteroidales bacterium]